LLNSVNLVVITRVSLRSRRP